jgi:predicted ATPase
MITRVKVKNFRSLADVDVELGPLTVLVGRNGAGKSNFLDVLRFVHDVLSQGLEKAVTSRRGISALRRRAISGGLHDIEISLTVEERDFLGEYTLVIAGKKQNGYYIKGESCRIKKGNANSIEMFDRRNGKWIVPPPNPFTLEGASRYDMKMEANEVALRTLSILIPDMTYLCHLLASTNFYTIFPEELREPQKDLHDYPLMEHGENLASVIQRQKEQTGWFPDLLASLNRIVGDVADIRVRHVGGYLVTELKKEVKDGQSLWFELAQESDGTLRTLGLLAALYQEGPHVLTAIEEPELTLHPGALGVLSDVLREASKRGQILITTQSPDLISRFGADELWVVERVNGMTQIGPIDETQREVINDQLFSAGDLLRIEGLHRAPVEAAGGGNA